MADGPTLAVNNPPAVDIGTPPTAPNVPTVSQNPAPTVTMAPPPSGPPPDVAAWEYIQSQALDDTVKRYWNTHGQLLIGYPNPRAPGQLIYRTVPLAQLGFGLAPDGRTWEQVLYSQGQRFDVLSLAYREAPYENTPPSAPEAPAYAMSDLNTPPVARNANVVGEPSSDNTRSYFFDQVNGRTVVNPQWLFSVLTSPNAEQASLPVGYELGIVGGGRANFTGAKVTAPPQASPSSSVVGDEQIDFPLAHSYSNPAFSEIYSHIRVARSNRAPEDTRPVAKSKAMLRYRL